MNKTKYISQFTVSFMILIGSLLVFNTSCMKEEVDEPITIDSPTPEPPEVEVPPVFELEGFTPEYGVPGTMITVTGSDLQKIESILFPGGTVVLAADFVEQTRRQIMVEVPTHIESGILTLTATDNEEPVNIETEENFFVFALTRTALIPVDAADAIISDNPDVWPDFIQSGGLNWSGQPFLAITDDAVSNGAGVKGNGTAIGNGDFIWGWGMNWTPMDFQSTKATHNLRIDMKLTKPFGSNPRFAFLINKHQINLGSFGFGADGTFEGWFTVEIDLSAYGNLPDGNIEATGDWGFIMDYVDGTADVTGLYMDNFRFSPK
ncbi:IPT/TIG domain-containing protein [Saccharicrinis aurantiacus]|uniref:IPT/TIG domain-containing protein n=1 Tax=Saccharicrinis aurantiacus TaxID=1849719 RepID=UPI0024918C55|nr:IPT/TIG domain-containing protein [Saccharicrinis aurantiacus]